MNRHEASLLLFLLLAALLVTGAVMNDVLVLLVGDAGFLLLGGYNIYKDFLEFYEEKYGRR